MPFIININHPTPHNKTHHIRSYVQCIYRHKRERVNKKTNSKVYHSHLFFDISSTNFPLSLQLYLFGLHLYLLILLVYYIFSNYFTIQQYTYTSAYIYILPGLSRSTDEGNSESRPAKIRQSSGIASLESYCWIRTALNECSYPSSVTNNRYDTRGQGLRINTKRSTSGRAPKTQL